MKYEIIEMYNDGVEKYVMDRELAIYVYGLRLWQQIVSGLWPDHYEVKLITN